MSHGWKRLVLLAGAAALAPWQAQADDYMLGGRLQLNTQIVQWEFTIGAPGDVSMWTFSHQGGLNFDPLLTVWNAATGSFVAQGDDVSPGMNGFDARVDLAGLAAGRYIVNLTASPNSRLGDLRSDGFLYDLRTAESISSWCQPAALTCGSGDLWQMWVTGVDTVEHLSTLTPAPVPEPASALLLLAGLAGVGAWARRRSAEVHAAA